MQRDQFEGLKKKLVDDESTEAEKQEISLLVQGHPGFNRELLMELLAYERLQTRLSRIIRDLKKFWVNHNRWWPI